MHCWQGLLQARQEELKAKESAGHPLKQEVVDIKPTGMKVPCLQTVQLLGLREHYMQEESQGEHM